MTLANQLQTLERYEQQIRSLEAKYHLMPQTGAMASGQQVTSLSEEKMDKEIKKIGKRIEKVVPAPLAATASAAPSDFEVVSLVSEKSNIKNNCAPWKKAFKKMGGKVIYKVPRLFLKEVLGVALTVLSKLMMDKIF